MSEREQNKVFSANINRILSQYGKTQKEVADAIGVSPQTFNTWCQGIALPRMGKLQLLADYFKLNKSDFIEPYLESPDNFMLSNDEQALVEAYRSADDGTKAAVRKLLDIKEEKKEVSSA